MPQPKNPTSPAPRPLDSVFWDIKRSLRINTWLLAITTVMLLALLVRHP